MKSRNSSFDFRIWEDKIRAFADQVHPSISESRERKLGGYMAIFLPFNVKFRGNSYFDFGIGRKKIRVPLLPAVRDLVFGNESKERALTNFLKLLLLEVFLHLLCPLSLVL